MIHNNVIFIVLLLLCITILVMLGQKLRIAYPVFLVIGGLLIGFVPGIPNITVDPELVFLIFLPPLLYEAAWFTSWKNFWEYKGAILTLAVAVVLVTSIVVGYVTAAVIPGFTLALGFLLGGIISPPDAVAATSVLKTISIPKSITSILEGESLVNDATSLIIFKFALAAILSGSFVLHTAALNFVLVAVMGAVIGLAVALLFYALHRWLPTTNNIDTVLTLLAPYCMYILAEQFHMSGVIAVVSGGLFLSSRSHEIFDYRTRMQTTSVWSALAFMLNGVVFILIGLALPSIVKGVMQDYSLLTAIGYGIGLSVLAFVVRMVTIFIISRVTWMVNKQTRIRYKGSDWRFRFVIAWAGMRGVVSLASALSVPVLLDNGAVFPQRNLILFLTFVVIFFTLVVQGLTLPLVIRKLHMPVADVTAVPEEEQEAAIQLMLVRVSLEHLNQNHGHQCVKNELLGNLKNQLQQNLLANKEKLESLENGTVDKAEIAMYNKIVTDLIRVQRHELIQLKKGKHYDDEVIRREEARLDLEEANTEYYLG